MNLKSISLAQIIQLLDESGYQFELFGNKNITINTFSSPHKKNSNSLYWINEKNKHLFESTMSQSVIITNAYNTELNKQDFAYISTEDDRNVFFLILNHFFSGISSFNVPMESEKSLLDFCRKNSIFIDQYVVIGRNVRIYPNVVILGKVHIGDNSVIGPGTVIGFDGFGYTKQPNGNLTKINHYGGVIIGKNVEIGANSCIDRGTLDDTIIGDNVKIDNLVHIAHNVIIENNVTVIANSMIAGSTIIGKNTHISPSSSILNKLNIGPDSYVGIGSVVLRDVENSEKVFGNPARKLL